MNILTKKCKSLKNTACRRSWSGMKRGCKSRRPSTSAGFTLIETLVAITILMIAIAGPLTVAEKSLSAAIYARDQLMASYLAQDAMEYVKNVVDTNEIIMNQTNNPAGVTWLSDGSDAALSSCNPSTPCTVDTINDVVQENCTRSSGGQISCPSPLHLGSNGYNQQSSDPQSPFTRYFYIHQFSINGGMNNAADVVVNVTWPGDVVGGGGVILEDTMFDTPLQ